MDVCSFCQPQVGHRRPAPVSPTRSSFTPRSRRAQPRPRITPPSSPVMRSPPARPQRNRRRPRHFDSSPDLDVPRRCERRNHIPFKPMRDFMDTAGRLHAVCNECRSNILERRPATPTPLVSSSDSELESLLPPPNSLMQQRFDMILC